MFTSTLNTAASLSITSAFLSITCALILGIAIALTYMASDSYSKNFVITLVMLPLLVQIVIMLVNGNLGTGIAVMGAFSLVRFRSIPGSSKEISFIFFAMATGLATGMGYITYALVTTLILCLVFLILSKSKFGSISDSIRKLKITIPEDLDYTEIFDDIFKTYTNKVELEKVKTTNLGSMFELNYNIELKDLSKEKHLLDELRCRNGNLTIICSRTQTKDDL
ncbi:MAG: hypothetical protein K0Q97_203 [Bacillota bacterium]|nr:hypothetical protein [Bacillota bacterium]